ncbi:MAG: Matrixin [Myxococcaceae bacterium]|nr:Matrixin [Myxococcaceae bacterium]
MSRLALLIALLALSGCAHAWPINVHLSTGLTEPESRAIKSAIDDWNRHLGEEVFVARGPAGSRRYASCDYAAQEASYEGAASAATTVVPCTGQLAVSSVSLVSPQVPRHLLGHVLGLGHATDPTSVMYRFVVPQETHILQSDVALVRRQLELTPVNWQPSR